MTDAKVTTNNIPRDVIYGYELTESERAEFDYLNWTGDDSEGAMRSFFRYKGELYDLGDCMRVEPMNSLCAGWDGYFGETYFSAVVVRYVDDFERVVVGRAVC